MQKKTIRVLQVVPNMQAGGLETLIMNIYRNIDRDKVQFDFLVHYQTKKHYDKEIEDLGGKIYRFPVREDKKIFKYIVDLNRFFKNHSEYKIVHCHMSSLGFLIFFIAKMNGIKIRIAHSHNSSNSKDIKGRFKRLLMLPYKYTSSVNFACSQESGNYLFGKRPFEVISNAIEVEKFSYNTIIRDALRKELNLTNKFVIGHVGRFNVQKNHNYLIELFNEVLKINEDARLLLIGDGELKEEIYSKVKKLNLEDKVIFLGIRSDISRLYQAMDCFCLPSLFEGLPLVGVESQSSGLKTFFSSNITQEIIISDLAKTIDINEAPSINAMKIMNENYNYNRAQYNEIIRNSIFNIKKISKKLEDFYINMSE